MFEDNGIGIKILTDEAITNKHTSFYFHKYGFFLKYKSNGKLIGTQKIFCVNILIHLNVKKGYLTYTFKFLVSFWLRLIEHLFLN